MVVVARAADDVAGRLLEDPDELAADDLALLLGVGDPGERRQEPLARRRRPRARRRSRRRSPSRPARPRPRAAARGRRRRRSAGRRRPSARAPRPPRSRRRRTAPQMHPRVADLRADRVDLLVDDVGRGPVGRRARRRGRGSSRAPAGRTSSACTSGCHCTPYRRRSSSSNAATGAPGGRRGDRECPSGAAVHRVAVAHPDRLLGGLAVEQGRRRCRRRRPASRRTRAARCARPCRRAPAPSPGSRSRCRTPARRPRTAPGRATGAPSA